MKILIVTGKLAEKTIKEKIENLKDVEVISLPVSVASFITPKYAAKQLEKRDLTKYDMIIMPGTINGDLSQIEKATGVPTYKGPLHAADLPLIISENIQLSKNIPANELILEKLKEKAQLEIESIENQWQNIIAEQGGVLIGDLPVAKGLPLRIIAEIVNAPTLSLEEISERALYYKSQGANIIDIGMLAGNPMPEKIPKIVNTLRNTVDLPLSIDSLNVEEIKTSIDCGIDLILSIDEGNMYEVLSSISNEAVVVLPSNMNKGYLPKTAEERVSYLSEIITRLHDHGIHKIIGDLVVEPLLKPGLIEGLKAYQLFNKKNPKIPLLFGVGNAVELIDADSPGVHAVLIALASETGACMLHVPEYSVKAKGSVFEAITASKMMFLAEKRGTAVKDLGLDLLILKEKRWKEQKFNPELEEKTKVLESIGNSVYHPDKLGWFKIQIDRNNNNIVAIYYPLGKNEPSTIIKGKDSRTIYQTIIREKLISNYDHAAYLGKELEKAAIALHLGRSYVQDKPLF
jgi:dihydropteroate synthase-like protein